MIFRTIFIIRWFKNNIIYNPTSRNGIFGCCRNDFIYNPTSSDSLITPRFGFWSANLFEFDVLHWR